MLTKENILQKISQEEIMTTYLTLSGGEFKVNHASLRNPFRSDKNPGSFMIYYNDRDVLVMKDFASPIYTGDCFHAVSWYLKNSGKSYSFNDVLKEINNYFRLNLVVNSFNVHGGNTISTKQHVDFKYLSENYKRQYGKSNVGIKFGFQVYSELTNIHLKYLDSYNISRKEATFFNVTAIKQFYYGQPHSYKIWRSEDNDPIFRYTIPEYKQMGDGTIEKTNIEYYQIYRPLSKIKNRKFKTNAKGAPLLGLEQALINKDKVASYKPELFITSSMKDVIVLSKFGIVAVAPIGEGTNIPNFLLDYLETQFSTIVINFDNDEAGVNATKALKKKRPHYSEYFVPEEHKDISTYYKEEGFRVVSDNLYNFLQCPF